MEADIERTLISRERIQQRVGELAAEISAQYADEDKGLVLVPILAGSLVFVADLIRQLPMKMKIGLISVSAYPGATTVGEEPRLRQDLELDISDRHVLIIDDILDTGRTLRSVKRNLAARGPASIRICVLLEKTAKSPKDLKPDFVGFQIEDVFVVGYGLDYDDHYRNWPEIGVLRRELYE